MDTENLKLVALQMANVRVDLPLYRLSKQECKSLRQDVEADENITSTVLEKLKKGQVELYFQPIIDISKNEQQLVYCEALARIRKKNKIIAADQFIRAVQSKRLGAYLDKTVFEQLSDIVPHIAKRLRGVSVNIFPDSFKDKDTMKALNNCLKNFEEQNLTLILEITEYNLFEHYQIVEKVYQRFPNTLKIAIDDFGSGYSSLASLIKLSQKGLLYALKIDGSLIQNILQDESSYEVVKMAMGLGKKLGANVIVEYIENEELLDKVKQQAEHFYAQGYLFGKAIPLTQIPRYSARK